MAEIDVEVMRAKAWCRIAELEGIIEADRAAHAEALEAANARVRETERLWAQAEKICITNPCLALVARAERAEADADRLDDAMISMIGLCRWTDEVKVARRAHAAAAAARSEQS